jgi:small subunit ribosomal protein S20
MPIIKSAKKQVRSAKRNYEHNLKYKETMKKAIAAYYKEKPAIGGSASGGKKEKKLSLAFKAIDKAQKIHFIHKNKAARIKSSLVKFPERKIKKIRKRARKISKKKKK